MKSWNYLCTQTNRLVNFNFHITFICLTIITLEFSFSNVKILMRIGTQILNLFLLFQINYLLRESPSSKTLSRRTL